MLLSQDMPVKAIAELTGEHDTRLWRIFYHYVEEARAKLDFSEVKQVGVDETAAKRGHDYITLYLIFAITVLFCRRIIDTGSVNFKLSPPPGGYFICWGVVIMGEDWYDNKALYEMMVALSKGLEKTNAELSKTHHGTPDQAE